MTISYDLADRQGDDVRVWVCLWGLVRESERRVIVARVLWCVQEALVCARDLG